MKANSCALSHMLYVIVRLFFSTCLSQMVLWVDGSVILNVALQISHLAKPCGRPLIDFPFDFLQSGTAAVACGRVSLRLRQPACQVPH